MLDQFVPKFKDHVFEGYNAKLPDDMNAYKNLDAQLKELGFKKRGMPTAKPEERRFMYWKGTKYVMVTAYYAGGDVYVEIPQQRTEVKLAQKTIGSFVNDHIRPYANEK